MVHLHKRLRRLDLGFIETDQLRSGCIECRSMTLPLSASRIALVMVQTASEARNAAALAVCD
jgi:hypothetical protein